MNTTVERLLLFIVVFLSVLYMPWWLTLLFTIGLAFYYPLYLEIIFFGFIFDHLFLASRQVPYLTLGITAFILIVISFIRVNIRR